MMALYHNSSIAFGQSLHVPPPSKRQIHKGEADTTQKDVTKGCNPLKREGQIFGLRGVCNVYGFEETMIAGTCACKNKQMAS